VKPVPQFSCSHENCVSDRGKVYGTVPQLYSPLFVCGGYLIFILGQTATGYGTHSLPRNKEPRQHSKQRSQVWYSNLRSHERNTREPDAVQVPETEQEPARRLCDFVCCAFARARGSASGTPTVIEVRAHDTRAEFLSCF
jgi:hypothetical protein